jgi:hypothetical protein
MKDVMKIRVSVSMLVLAMGSISYGQAIPAGGASMSTNTSGPNLPNLDGIVHYALSASEIIQYGYYGSGQVTNSTALSGDVAYTAKSTVHPFNLLFAGGVILPNQSGQGTTYYSSAAVSQGYVTRHWNFNISDTVSYLPQSPTTGLSGIAGVGDLGSLPVEGPVTGPAGGIFTNAGNRISNTLTGGTERQINHDTSVSGFGSWSLLHFLDNNGLDSTDVSGMVALNRRLDARSTVSLNAVYTTISYSGDPTLVGLNEPDIETRGINVSYSRVLNRSLSMSVSGGPEWISSSNSTLIPASINASASASLSYSHRLTGVSVGYSHGVNAGSGVLPGAISDNVFASVSHTYGRKWVAALNAGYTHSSGLTEIVIGNSIVPTNGVFDSTFAGVQVTRAISTHFSGFASYTIQDQSSKNALFLQNALNGTSQTFGIGITYTPRSTRLGQF